MTHAELMSRMSTTEYIHWLAFFKLEQEDHDRAMQAAQDKADAQNAMRKLAGRV